MMEMEGKEQVKRLLCITSSMNRGGAETFLMKVYRALDKSKYQMDFCVTESGVYDEEIKSLGGNIYFVTAKSQNPVKSFLEIKSVVKENNYKRVLRTSQQSLATLDLVAAKCGGAKKLIYRSSNAGMTGGKISRCINSLFSFLPKIVPTVKIAPSTEAAEFVFGEKAVKNGEVTIMPNGLDYSLFKFDQTKREKIRKELHLEDKVIIGHVGRFNKQKNHEFLLDIFNEVHKENDKAHLLLIGKGELESEIKEKIAKLGLSNFATTISPVPNVNEYYMAMDVLVFPSFFEGMPNVVIEAQATDLPCIVSDTITKEANITGKISYMSINESAENWSANALKKCDIKRGDNKEIYLKKGYIINENIDSYIKILF